MKELTLSDVMHHWLCEYVAGTVLPNTLRSYTCVVFSFLRNTDANLRSEDFNRHLLQKALNNMVAEGLSKSTVTKAAQFVSRAYLDVLDIYIGKVRIPRDTSSKKVEALTIEEQALIEDACLNILNGHLFLFLLDTGIRGKELCNLKWENYDGKGIYIKQSKTEKSERYVPLTQRAGKIIEERGSKTGKYIFVSDFSGNQITETVLKKVYCNLRKETGIQSISTRVCRHTFATRLFEMNAHPKTVSELLGHTSVAFTLQRYTSISVEALEQGIDLLEQLQGSQLYKQQTLLGYTACYKSSNT